LVISQEEELITNAISHFWRGADPRGFAKTPDAFDDQFKWALGTEGFEKKSVGDRCGTSVKLPG
tara:strand:- start:2671 stop:2862 length:192 start_codon:yes stop_codon:yes gene_type:complete